jgi:hypothetical protein
LIFSHTNFPLSAGSSFPGASTAPYYYQPGSLASAVQQPQSQSLPSLDSSAFLYNGNGGASSPIGVKSSATGPLYYPNFAEMLQQQQQQSSSLSSSSSAAYPTAYPIQYTLSGTPSATSSAVPSLQFQTGENWRMERNQRQQKSCGSWLIPHLNPDKPKPIHDSKTTQSESITNHSRYPITHHSYSRSSLFFVFPDWIIIGWPQSPKHIPSLSHFPASTQKNLYNQSLPHFLKLISGHFLSSSPSHSPFKLVTFCKRRMKIIFFLFV